MVLHSKVKDNTRVRGILISSDRGLLTIKRSRAGQEPYWVFPGGGVEPTDATVEAALIREVAEELGGVIEIQKLIYVLTRAVDDGQTQDELFFLCRLVEWTGEQTGPEFAGSGRGEYALEEIPLAAGAIEARNLKPDEVRDFLSKHVGEIEILPDLRADLFRQ